MRTMMKIAVPSKCCPNPLICFPVHRIVQSRILRRGVIDVVVMLVHGSYCGCIYVVRVMIIDAVNSLMMMMLLI